MDRRKAHRAPLLLEVRYSATNPTPAGGGKAAARDISRTGMALVFERPLAPRTVVEVELKIPGWKQPLKAKGQVVWQRNIPGSLAPAFMTGLSFVHVDPVAQEQIDRFVTTQLSRSTQTLDDKAVDLLDRGLRTAQEPWPIQMATLRTTHARVAAIGAYLPSTRLTNEDLVKQAEVNLQPVLLQRALGVVERRVAPPEDTAADLMARAGRVILERSGCEPKDLDRIICSCDPGESSAPGTAVAVQAKLGARCPAFDVVMSCAGWICGIDVACRCLTTGEKRILVLASAMATKPHFHDLKHRAIFGDGAGGVLVEAADADDGLIATELWTNGQFYSAIYLPYPWSTRPSEIPSEYGGSFYMDPNRTVFFKALEDYFPTLVRNLLKKAALTISDIDHVLLHQPSLPLFEHSLRVLDWIPRPKVFGIDYFAQYGNLVGAEFPVMLEDGIQRGLIKRGDLVMMATYGAGFTMAGMIFRY